jgi:hypothetical protein
LCGAKPPTAKIPFSSLQQEERLICPSSQGNLPAIDVPQWIHLFQQKDAAAKIDNIFFHFFKLVTFCEFGTFNWIYNVTNEFQ